jgi:hypothetical protein
VTELFVQLNLACFAFKMQARGPGFDSRRQLSLKPVFKTIKQYKGQLSLPVGPLMDQRVT